MIWRFALVLFLLCMVTSFAHADVKAIDAVFLKQQGSLSTVMLLPCNWNKQVDDVTLFGYYGENSDQLVQTVIQPEKMSRYEDTMNLQLTLPGDVMDLAGLPLHHIDIDYKTTNKRCSAGFGFGFGVTQ